MKVSDGSYLAYYKKEEYQLINLGGIEDILKEIRTHYNDIFYTTDKYPRSKYAGCVVDYVDLIQDRIEKKKDVSILEILFLLDLQKPNRKWLSPKKARKLIDSFVKKQVEDLPK